MPAGRDEAAFARELAGALLLSAVQLVCLGVLFGNSQNDPTGKRIEPEISGVVVEAGTLMPVPQARVSLIRLPTKGPIVVSISTPKGGHPDRKH